MKIGVESLFLEERKDISTHFDRLLGPTRQAMNSEGFNAALMSIVQRLGVDFS